MLGERNLKTNLIKGPNFFGFFIFLLFLFSLFYLQQVAARILFLIHSGIAKQLLVSEMACTFTNGFRLDIAATSYLMLGFLTLFLFVQFLPNSNYKLKKIILLGYFICSSLFLVLLALLDAELFKSWNSRVNSDFFEYMKHPAEALGSASHVSLFAPLLLILLWICLFTVVYKIVNRNYFNIWISKRIYLKNYAILLLWIIISGILARGSLGTIPISFSSAYFSPKNAANLAAVNGLWNFIFHGFNPAANYDIKQYQYLSKKESIQYLKLYQQFGTDSMEPLSALPKPNVVVIMLESFDAYVSQFFTQSNIHLTPQLDRMAQEGYSFTQCFSPCNRTDKALAVLFSAFPGLSGKSILNYPDKAMKLPMLPKKFLAHGYQTHFWYGGDMNFANMKSYLSAAGFQNMIEFADLNSPKQCKWGVYDETLFNRFVSGSKYFSEPFFATILTASSHEPYDIPGANKTKWKNRNDGFYESVKYTDKCLFNLFQSLQSLPWYKNTLFVFTADHGRPLGILESQPEELQSHRIPFFFYGPVLNPFYKNKKNETLSCQTDFANTLLAGLFGTTDTNFFLSRNLISKNTKNSAQSWIITNQGWAMLHGKNEAVFFNDKVRKAEYWPNKTKEQFVQENIGKSLQYFLLNFFQDL